MDQLTAMIPLMAQERPIERTALNRLLYFADLTHLLEHGETISGTPQLKCYQGPKPRGSFEARCRAIGAGLLDESVTEARAGRFRVFRYGVPAGADLAPLRALLGPSACRTIDAVRHRLGGRSASYLFRAAYRFEPLKSGAHAFELDLAQSCGDRRLKLWLTDNGLLPA